MACFLCHVFQTLGHIFCSLSSKLQQKSKRIHENWKQGHRHTTTFSCQVFCIPKQKRSAFLLKNDPFFWSARAARAFFFLKKFTFQKHQTVSQILDCHFLRGVHFSKISGKRSSWKRTLSRIRLFTSRGPSAGRSGSGLRRE